ncbi:MAG: glycoside hydrolase family 99-like domain-containing protein [Desulfovibrio sp.]|jgi:2-polyprenyl-3-methyl-5-hydroxy-6-metoxy-1,4-benzoquinol methylase|nr:glycoside hydrolase family 99-like domain-containing protein [Desulfovibrio sp.]
MLYIVCHVADALKYEKFFLRNQCLQDAKIKIVPLVDKKISSPAILYNSFLEALPNDAERLLFTRDQVEFLQNPLPILERLEENALYGVWGARLTRNGDGTFCRECRGLLQVQEDGAPPRAIYNDPPEAGTACPVEALDGVCLVAPAKLFRKCGPRFDPGLALLYAEDFCLQVWDRHALPSMATALLCRLHGSPFPEVERLEADINLCRLKYASSAPRCGARNIFGGNGDGVDPGEGEAIYAQENNIRNPSKIYTEPVKDTYHNAPATRAAAMLRPGSRILDVGCATGDNGLFLRDKLGAELYGMDYSEESLNLAARKRGVYKKLHHVDLNTLRLSAYSQYYNFFDCVLLLDVLEHLYDPLKILQQMNVFLKKEGSFIISIPNLANIYPTANLLRHDFSYQDFGILDRTHIRFFTWKSLALFLAEGGFLVEDCDVTFASPESRGMFTPKSLPRSFYDFMLEDARFLVRQYVCKVKKSSANFGELKECNRAALEPAARKNAAGRREIAPEVSRFKRDVALTLGGGLSEAERRVTRQLVAGEKFVEAALLSGLFDEKWYRKTYREVDFGACHPIAHYLSQGWREGKNPSEAFDGGWYLRRHKAAAESGLCPLLFHIIVGVPAGLPHNAAAGEPPQSLRAELADYVFRQQDDFKNTFVPPPPEPLAAPERRDTKLVAFYLPQYYPFPENDKWWGKGFTEWTNVTKAAPQFVGHYQPRLPHDVGFYDLRCAEIALYQEQLAQQYGIHGFCYHYYWFGGKKIMQMPIERKLADKTMALPFCLSWANEPWSANWDGSKNNLLIDQPETINTDKLFRDLLPFFADPRYIKIDGKPFFMIYRPNYFRRREMRACVDRLRHLAQKAGFDGLHVVLGDTSREGQKKFPLTAFDADAFVEFPPHNFIMKERHDVRICNPSFKGRLFDLPELVALYKQRERPAELTYRTVFPMWDNTSRKCRSGAMIFTKATPETYYDWLSWDITTTKANHSQEHNFVFINAWNEWAEGAHLEPDKKYGYAFLEMTRKALCDSRNE